jgi:hypothetical protein
MKWQTQYDLDHQEYSDKVILGSESVKCPVYTVSSRWPGTPGSRTGWCYAPKKHAISRLIHATRCAHHCFSMGAKREDIPRFPLPS